MLDVSSLFAQNPWWKDRNLIEDDPKVKSAFSSNPRKLYEYIDENLMVIGPRQVGKTTFIKLVIRDLLINKKVEPRNVLYFSCESLATKEDILHLVSAFDEISKSSSKKYLFLDEITFVKDWNVALLNMFNTDYADKNRIYVTGSSSASLQKETLPGRNIKKMIFYPLSFRDFVDLFYKKISNAHPDIHDFGDTYRSAVDLMPYINELNRYLNTYLSYTGGFLSTSYRYFQKNDDPFPDFYETYRDSIISELAKLDRSENTFKQVISGIIDNYGSRYSANSIARKTSIGSHKTVESYEYMMEKLFLVETILNKKNGKIIYRGNKKTYFVDPFFYRVFNRYAGYSNIPDERDKPKILEGAVCTHLYRRFKEVFYLATKTGKEVDFLIDGIGIEVKYNNRDIRELNHDEGYLLVKDSMPSLRDKKMTIPASVFLYLAL